MGPAGQDPRLGDAGREDEAEQDALPSRTAICRRPGARMRRPPRSQEEIEIVIWMQQAAADDQRERVTSSRT